MAEITHGHLSDGGFVADSVEIKPDPPADVPYALYQQREAIENARLAVANALTSTPVATEDLIDT